MQNQYNKVYLGNGKKNENYDIVYARLYLDDAARQLIKVDAKGRQYLDINVGLKREMDKYGFTHSVWVNDKIEEPAPQQFNVTPQQNYPQQAYPQQGYPQQGYQQAPPQQYQQVPPQFQQQYNQGNHDNNSFIDISNPPFGN